MSYGMFLAGSYKYKNHFLSTTVDVVPWPASLFSCVVFYDDLFADFVAGHRDCATHRTVTVFDVEGALPHHHVQVLYSAPAESAVPCSYSGNDFVFTPH